MACNGDFWQDFWHNDANRFFPMVTQPDGRVLLRLQIQKRTLATAQLMITQEFWDAFKGQLGDDVIFLWKADPERYGNERLSVTEKPDGTACFDIGWLRFYKRHELGLGDILHLTYVGNSTFHVEHPCYGWLPPEKEEIQVDPNEVIDLVSEEDEPDADNDDIPHVVIEDEPEQPTPAVARRSGKKRATIDMPYGYHFGCAYPLFRDQRKGELGFSFDDAHVLRWYRASWDWNIHHSHSNRVWKVRLHTYMSQKRHVFLAGWKDVRADLNIVTGDIVCFQLLDWDPANPCLRLYHEKPN